MIMRFVFIKIKKNGSVGKIHTSLQKQMLLGQFMIFFQRLRVFLVQIDDVISSLLLLIDISSLMQLRPEEVNFRFFRFVLLSIAFISGQTV